MRDVEKQDLSELYTGVIHDVLRGRGLEGKALPASIVPISSGQVVAAEAFTVQGAVDREIDAHESLLRWTEFLSEVPAGRVVVCQPNDSVLAHMGELSAETLEFRDVRGFIVDGGCRDTSFIKKRGFPVWCRYRTPVDIVGKWKVTELGGNVQIGGVRVGTDDFVVADDDGVMIVPSAIADEVVDEALSMVKREDLVRKAILEGVSPRDAYVRYRKF